MAGQGRPIWHGEWRIEDLAALTRNTLVDHLGIEFVEIGHDTLKARMPVRRETAQRLGYLHGGASVALAETVGSLASQMCIDRDTHASLGLDINANHLRAVAQGQYVFGIARPIHLGRQVHVWEVRVETDDGKMACIGRLTTSIQPRARSGAGAQNFQTQG
ncbi:MAG: hotdog fold thioesterase [Pseudomonadota bacterium]